MMDASVNVGHMFFHGFDSAHSIYSVPPPSPIHNIVVDLYVPLRRIKFPGTDRRLQVSFSMRSGDDGGGGACLSQRRTQSSERVM